MRPHYRRFLWLGVIACGAVSLPAHAYLDPASGSLILQLVLGGLAGLVLLIKLYWHKLKDALGLSKEKPEAEQ